MHKSNHSNKYVVAVVLAGGSGTRFSDEVNKVYVPLESKTVIEYSLDIFQASPLVDEIQVVVRELDLELWDNVSARRNWSKLKGSAVGGNTRHESEWAAMSALSERDVPNDAVVLLHDGARPFVTHQLIEQLVAVTECGFGGVPSHSLLADVIADDPTLTTGNLVTVQTPQSFVLGDLLSAYSAAAAEGFHAVDTSQTIEVFSDVRVKVVDSDTRNIKITRKTDLDTAHELLAEFKDGRWL